MSKNRNSLFIVFTGIIIAVCRFILGSIETKAGDDYHILIIMAVVNYVALGFVLLFLYNDFYTTCNCNISERGLDTALKKSCRSVMFMYSSILLISYLILGILYMQIFKSADLNDVISIVALALSIATNGLIDDYKDSYYKLVIKTAKISIELKKKFN